jgi:hypothetical protein
MRYLPLLATSAFLIVTSDIAGAAPISPAGLSLGGRSPVVLVQEKKSEPLKEKVKRAWKNMVGYKFDVGCPALIPLSHKTCTETGKNSADARAKCQAQNQLCQVTASK